MPRVLALAIACAIGLTTAAESLPRKRSAPQPERTLPKQPVQIQDEYKSCDVAVRDYVAGRKEATALPVKGVKVDGLRMTLNFIHPYGESGDTPPNLSFLRGESVEERRKALNEAKQRTSTLTEAAKSGNIWYVIVLRNNNLELPDARRSPSSVQLDESRLSASAVVLANVENRCITVTEFRDIPPDRVSGDLRKLLGERDHQASPADTSVTGSVTGPGQGAERLGESDR
jgi:hypothetical protein